MDWQHDIHILPLTCTLLLIMTLGTTASNGGVFDVTSYGAKGDAKDDDSGAFLRAWSAACSYSQGDSTMLIPEGSYSVGPLMFRGPCSAKVKVQLNGNLLASTDIDDYAPKNARDKRKNWIEFMYIDGLNIIGVGVLDGQGASAWPLNNCSQKHCISLPITLVLSSVRNANICSVSSINSKFFHMTIFRCEEVTMDSITITAPEESPNTDGIHISDSTSVAVLNSAIGTGDDCISIGPGNTNVTITNVSCGPGHGISVGSLGGSSNEKPVKGLTVTNCTFNQSHNGVRIKTWQSSASSSLASGFVFEDITMISVKNPIIIDQKYCPYNHCNTTEPSKVQIKDVKFRNFNGTSSTVAAINLVCSDWFPCEEIELSNITLMYNGPKPDIKNTIATCVNARGTSSGTMNPKSCLVPESFYHPYSSREYLLKISSEDMIKSSSSVRTTRDAITSLFVSLISFNFSLLLLSIPEVHHRVTIPYLLANLLLLANVH